MFGTVFKASPKLFPFECEDIYAPVTLALVQSDTDRLQQLANTEVLQQQIYKVAACDS
jgi:hypothetical protein